jgi:outer membrane receptor protein involved in Fe transport
VFRTTFWAPILGFFCFWSVVPMGWGQPSASAVSAIESQASPTPVETAYQMPAVVVYGQNPQGNVIEGPALDSLKADSRLADLLDKQSDLETEGLGVAKSFANVSIRGSATNQTLVLLNGQRTNQGFDLSMIPTEDVERIEIIKGPAALAYGPDATGGVINVITRVQAQRPSLGASVGEFVTDQVHASTGDWTLGPWQGSLSGNWFNTNGYTTNTDLVNGELDQSSHFDLGPDQLGLTADYVYKNGGSPNGDSLSAFDTGQFDTDDREKKQAFSAILSDQRALGGWNFNPSFSYNYANVLRLNPLGPDATAGVPQADQNIYDTYDFLASGSKEWNDWFHSLSFGFEFRSEQVQGTEGLGDGVRTDDVTSFSTQGLWNFSRTLSLQWSGRLDWYDTYHLASFNPEGSLKYQWAQDQDLYFSAGTGFRVPDFDELYHPSIAYIVGPDTPVEFGAGETGNPNLKPERSVNLEIGTDLKWGNWDFNAGGFLNLYHDLIIPDQDTNAFWTFENIADARLIGFEAGFNWDFADWGSFYGGYTFVDSSDTQTHALIPGRMRDKLSGGFMFRPFKGAELNIYDTYVDRNPALYTGPQDDPPLIVASAYSTLNLDFKTQLGTNAKAFLSFKNLLNQQYATVQGLLMPGRYFELGTTVAF